jgi:hypothetical protein
LEPAFEHARLYLEVGSPHTTEQFSSETLTNSLMPGLRECLKTRPDGTILDGHHRVFVLRERGVDVDSLPRDIVVKDQD